MSLNEYDRLSAAGTTDEEMLCILAVYGVRVAELDGLHGFAAAEGLPGARVAASSVYGQPLERLLVLADLFHARHLQVFGTSNTDQLEDDAVEKFRRICDQAFERRLEVSLEPRANTNIASIQTAAMIVSRAQCRNAGISIDTRQHFATKNAAEDLLSVQAAHISMIRLSHGVTAQEALEDAHSPTQNRRGYGEDDGALIRVLRTLTQNGVSAPISVDVTSYHPMLTDPFATCAFLEDKTSSIWGHAIQV